MRNVTRGARVKGRISPATVIASVALFFSLGGVGMAATGYRITSLWQIAPSVRHQLRGERGAQGPIGPAGPAGAPAKNSIVGTALWFSEPGASVAQSDPREGNMTTAQPAAAVVANCPDGTFALEGGYTGNNELVTVDTPDALAGPVPPPGWIVDARLVPGESAGWVTSWALCVPNLPPS